MDGDLTRRRLLVLGGAGAVSLAGCADFIDDDTIPTVVERRPAELTEPVEGSIEVEALVHNSGAAGDIEITIEAIDLDAGEITNTTTFVEFFDRDEQRWVSTEFEPGEDADGIFAEGAAV